MSRSPESKPTGDSGDDDKCTNLDAGRIQCGRGCIATLIAIVLLMILLFVFYEPTSTTGDMCKIYG